MNSSTKDNHSYKEHAVYQQESLHNGLVEILVGGLEKLDFLTNVALDLHGLTTRPKLHRLSSSKCLETLPL